jgi:hypothetical protein
MQLKLFFSIKSAMLVPNPDTVVSHHVRIFCIEFQGKTVRFFFKFPLLFLNNLIILVSYNVTKLDFIGEYKFILL